LTGWIAGRAPLVNTIRPTGALANNAKESSRSRSTIEPLIACMPLILGVVCGFIHESKVPTFVDVVPAHTTPRGSGDG
jgi:hypothetical protein